MNARYKVEPYKIEAERITYVEPATKHCLGGWAYSRQTLGEIVIEAEGLDHAERLALIKFPKANALRVFNRPPLSKGWELLACSTWPSTAQCRPYSERHPEKKKMTVLFPEAKS